MKPTLATLFLALTLGAQTTPPQTSPTQPIAAPFGQWVFCELMPNPPAFIADQCAANPITSRPWAIYAWARNRNTVAFRYTVTYVDPAGNPGTATGAFLRHDQANTVETIYWPADGLQGKLDITSVVVEDLIAGEKNQ